ncbi:MAG TPA: CpsB/CapC family capsule biosynthesis tyrosine phosphatase [Solirubrobacterales bacterium]|jgi:protein-tyrosine phosphatase|nr:CpsB/CapC family capsule biosynthesis tyrosine phosphatase [Solirubrobacterales bacterium]
MPIIVVSCPHGPVPETLFAPMIDLHCHILPGVDDGSLDLADSLAMARQAVNDGIERVCATPHIRHDHDVRIEQIAGRIEDLNRALRDEGLSVEVLQGGEVAETAVEDLSEEELGRVALGDGHWILLEPAPGPLSETLIARVGHLAERGHRALIAHPERHLSADMYERIAALIAAGALVQATADFFLRERFADGMRMLAEQGLVHVLSSDAHSSHGGRPLHMREAFECLAEIDSVAPHLEWMRDIAPQAIVDGGELTSPFEGRSR